MKKSIGIGFIGGGFITRFHIQSLIGVRNCEVLGVMSRTESSAEESASLARTIELDKQKLLKLYQKWLLTQILTLCGYALRTILEWKSWKRLLIQSRLEEAN